MTFKSIIIAASTLALLTACAGIEKRMIDGKERDVFVGVVGAWTKEGETLDSFNAVSRPCQDAAIKAQSGNHLDRLIPYNYNARRRHFIAVSDDAVACLQAAGFTFLDHGREYKLMKEQLNGSSAAK
jgi:hypothetical protein